MGLNAVFSFGFAGLFSAVGWMPHGGLALANSLATALEAVTLFVLMRRKLEGIDGTYIAQGVIQYCLAASAMAISILIFMQFAGDLNPWLVGLGGVVVGGIVYSLAAILLKVSEVQMLLGTVMQRLGH